MHSFCPKHRIRSESQIALLRFIPRGCCPRFVCLGPCSIGRKEAIRKNFILVYELLDETLDYGYPQGTSTETLKNHVRNEPILVESAKSVRLPAVSGATCPSP